MLSCQLIMNALERIAPRRLAEDWDNPGLLVGSYAQKVGRVLVALDVDDAVVAEAIERKADMIVAHQTAAHRPPAWKTPRCPHYAQHRRCGGAYEP